MDFRQVINRQFISITNDFNTLATNNSINKEIQLRFLPDEVVLRQMTYAATNDDIVANSIVCRIYSNLTLDPYLGTFTNYVNTNSNVHHHLQLNNPRKSSTYNFQFYGIDNVLVTCGAGGQVTGQLGIMLEFIEYAKK